MTASSEHGWIDKVHSRGSSHFDCDALATYLQAATERKDTALSHELHDELGGLMGAAVMDLDVVRRLAPGLSRKALRCVDRVTRTLEQAIDLKRRVTEELRPSILDNFGLYPALRWQLKKTWANSQVTSSETYPDVEPEFQAGAAIALFRIAQEALTIVLLHKSVKFTDLTVRMEPGNFWMTFSHDGAGNTETEAQDPAVILASMKNRIRAFGGWVESSETQAGGTAFTVWMPIQQPLSAMG